MEEIPDLRRLCLKLRHAVNKALGDYPAPGKPVSVLFEEQCYEVFNEKDSQHVALMGLKPGTFIRLKLLGTGKVNGTIRLVFREDGSLVLHVMKPL